MKSNRTLRNGLWAAVAAAAMNVSAASAQEKDLLGWWKLDEGQGQVAADSSGRGHPGKTVGAEWAPARPEGFALELNGIKSHVSVGHADDLNLDSELTIAAWVFPVDLAGDGAFLVKGRDYFASGYMFMRQAARLRFSVATERTPGAGASGRGYDALVSGPILAAGRWQHVAVVYSATGNKAALYHDGRKILQLPADGRIVWLQPKLPLNLGAASYAGYSNLRGFLRDVRLHAAALDDRQIRAQYDDGLRTVATLAVTPKEERLALAYPARLDATLADARTGKPLAAKVFVKGHDGTHYWPKDSFAYGLAGPRQCFYASGSFELPLPTGRFKIEASSGFEYAPLQATVEISSPGPHPARLAMTRLVDMPAQGWYAGEHHLHPLGHGGRRYDQRMTLANAAAICRAEGLQFAYWMGPRGDDIRATAELPDPWIVDGRLGQLFAADGFVGQCCVEPIGMYGHRCVVGAPHWTVQGNPQFQAISIFDQVRRQGGLCIFSHPYAGGLPLDKDGGLVFARELPVAVALGRATMWDLLCGGGRWTRRSATGIGG